MRCAKGFPFPQKLSADSTHECNDWCPSKDGNGRCRLADRHEYSRLKHEDYRVSPYHLITLLACPKHENVQVVTAESFAAYLVKYAAKVEPVGKVGNPLDDLPESQLPRAGPAQSGLQSVSQKQLPYIHGRSIAMSEAVIILAGQSMCLKSREYKHLDTALPHLRRMVVRRGGGQGGVMDGMIEKYQNRPVGDCVEPDNDIGEDQDFDIMGYVEFWEHWNMGKDAKVKLPNYINEVGTNYWRKRDGARILGHSCYRPDRQPFEQFYYHHLITSKPFRNINDLFTEENVEGTYERQCEIDEIFGDPLDRPKYLQGVLRALDKDLKRGKVSSIPSSASWAGYKRVGF